MQTNYPKKILDIIQEKHKEYLVRMYVGALYEGNENNPDIGDFEGDIEDGIFDGMLCVKVKATNEEEAKKLGKIIFETANCGVLTDFCLDDANIEIELNNNKSMER